MLLFTIVLYIYFGVKFLNQRAHIEEIRTRARDAIWVKFFSKCVSRIRRLHARGRTLAYAGFSIRNWRAGEITSRLTNSRRACQSQTFRLIFYPSLPPASLASSCRPSSLLFARFCHAGSVDALKLKTLEMGPFKASLCARLAVGCLVKKAERKGSPSEMCLRMPFRLFIRISRSRACGATAGRTYAG